MIIVFHILNWMISNIGDSKPKGKNYCDISESNSVENRDAEANLKFDPPVYRQRYLRVFEVLSNEKFRTNTRKLVDFGCAEFSLFVFIKRLSALNEIVFVDIDEELLKENTLKLNPLTIDYLRRRPEALKINVFAGSVGDPDHRLLETDAVTAIELIEHLYPDVLEKFVYNIFGFIRPKLVIVTTPNADFNVLLPNFKGFRHDDHKFEWSREQFEDWSTNITSRYPDYLVTFSGIGEIPKMTESLGCCSQMAVFTRKDFTDPEFVSENFTAPCKCGEKLCLKCVPNESIGVCTVHSKSYSVEGNKPNSRSYYKLVTEIEYPVDRDSRTENEKIIDEFRYLIGSLGQTNGRYYSEEFNRAEIPLPELICSQCHYEITPSKLNELLLEFGHKTEECFIEATGKSELCVIYEPEMENSSVSSEASGYDSDYGKCQANEEYFSDWDEPHKSDDKTKDKKPKEEKSSDVPESENPVDDIEEDKKQQESLFDSGYQKSLSILGDSPETPSADFELLEDPKTPPKAYVSDSKVNTENNKIDINKINELDGFANPNQGYHLSPTKTFISSVLKSPIDAFRKSHVKDGKELALPGPSNIKKKKKVKKTSSSTESDDDNSVDDVKSIANCLLENTLNKLVVEGEDIKEVELIEDQIDAEPEPFFEVENGDLANNNRDNEGNNYVAPQEDNVEEHDFENDNIDVPVEENANFENDNADLPVNELPAEPILGEREVIAVAQASREALFDPDSQEDLLEEFDLPAPQEMVNSTQEGNFFLFGVHFLPEDADAATAPENQNGFPAWLLQILGAHITPGENPEDHGEPHFYCQGDGLGVHPSIIAVDVDEDETSTDSSSTNNSMDFAEVAQRNSEPDGLPSLSEDMQTANTESAHVVNDVRVVPSDAEEFFDSVEDSSAGPA